MFLKSLILIFTCIWLYFILKQKSCRTTNQNSLFDGTEVNFFPQGNNKKKPRSILNKEVYCIWSGLYEVAFFDFKKSLLKNFPKQIYLGL